MTAMGWFLTADVGEFLAEAGEFLRAEPEFLRAEPASWLPPG